MIKIDSLDHMVLTVKHIDDTVAFYTQVLGMEALTFGNGRKSLHFGKQKINLHLAGHEFEPKAKNPTPGSADLCFITTTPMDAIIKHLASCGIEPLMPPSNRTGATGKLLSVYINDPDFNLIEISNLVS